MIGSFCDDLDLELGKVPIVDWEMSTCQLPCHSSPLTGTNVWNEGWGYKGYIFSIKYAGGGREGAGGLNTGDDGLTSGEATGEALCPGPGERERGGGWDGFGGLTVDVSSETTIVGRPDDEFRRLDGLMCYWHE